MTDDDRTGRITHNSLYCRDGCDGWVMIGDKERRCICKCHKEDTDR